MIPKRPFTYTTDAVVLRISNLGEADRIVTLIAPVHGLIRGVAKSARKPNSKLGGHLDLFRHVIVSVRETRSLHGLSQVSTVNGFRGLRDNLQRFSHAAYVSELSERFSVESGANRPLFQLLINVLESLETTTNQEMTVRFFEMRLLQLNGFAPELSRCVETGVELEPNNHLYSPDRGGLIHNNYQPSGEIALLPASLNTIKLLRFLSKTDITQAGKLKAKESDIRQLSRILREQIHHVLDRRLRSEPFMDEVRTRHDSNQISKQIERSDSD